MGLSAASLVGAYLRYCRYYGHTRALGGVAILLFFFNLLWTVFVFGAEVTKVYGNYLKHGDIVEPSRRERATLQPQDYFGRTRVEVAGADLAAQPRRDGVVGFLMGAVIGWLIGRMD
jgi:hypothetical protein